MHDCHVSAGAVDIRAGAAAAPRGFLSFSACMAAVAGINSIAKALGLCVSRLSVAL
jgi:hypothetical protein